MVGCLQLCTRFPILAGVKGIVHELNVLGFIVLLLGLSTTEERHNE